MKTLNSASVAAGLLACRSAGLPNSVEKDSGISRRPRRYPPGHGQVSVAHATRTCPTRFVVGLLVAGITAAVNLQAGVNDLRITEVNPASGQVEVTHVGATQFTTATSLPFCHRFNYFSAIPASTTFGPGESKVFVVGGLNATDSDIWLYRDGNFTVASSIITGMKYGPAANVGRAALAASVGLWPSASAFVPVPAAGQSLQPVNIAATSTTNWFSGPPNFGSFNPPNVAPTVTITAPTNGTVFATSPANVTIIASATDPDGSVVRVRFFNGTNLLGEVTTTPFQVMVALTNGQHSLTAEATDNSNTTTVSSPVNITVNPGGTPITNAFPNPIAKGDVTIELRPVAEGLISPLGLAVPDDGSGRLFVYDQAGLIHVIAQGALLPGPLLDVSSRLVPLGVFGAGSFDERGLLGAATHPNFAQHPRIYTYTSEPIVGTADFTTPLPAGRTPDHQSVIAEWTIDPANSNRVDLATRRELLRIDEPQFNHNAGTLRFGPDGWLYIAVGDGGGADDEDDTDFFGQPLVGHGATGNGQNLARVHGKVLRIDVDGTNSANGNYGIPAANPFVGSAGVDEIFALGFRNPFNFSFDQLTGALWLGDVGQNEAEEINVVVAGGNYGWRIKEGSFFFDPNGTGAGFITTQPVQEPPPGLMDPIAQYGHNDGLAVIGGHVYRGTHLPALAGSYVLGDWGSFGGPSGRLFYWQTNSGLRELRIGPEDRPLGLWLKGFGQDAKGEIYVCGSPEIGPFGQTGKVLKIIPVEFIVRVAATQQGNDLLLQWEGGVGPFTVERKAALGQTSWETFQTTANRSLAMPLTGPEAFFRVRDDGQNE